ncbi:MAG TPA: arginine deiminase family protein [Thermomicrobiaceae bacterium]|nr:arginine deiminase family protein [Thermomicrobiaceae bacterium]
MTESRAWGGQSMVAPLRRVLVFPPVPPGPEVSWEAFGYLRPIDHALAAREHATFRRILQAAGAEVICGEIDEPGLQDAIFPFDPLLTTDQGVILLRPGKDLRLGEVALAERTLAELGVPVVGRIEAPGTLEGGDTLWLDPQTLIVGRSYRSNDAGIEQLRALLAAQGVAVIAYDLPHWHGRGEVLHLLSLISPVDERLAVVYLPLLPARLVELLEARGWDLIEVPDEEFASQGPNVLALAPRRCLLLRENAVTAKRLRAAGCEATVFAGDEISHNRTGGPTCLTRPLLRQMPMR